MSTKEKCESLLFSNSHLLVKLHEWANHVRWQFQTKPRYHLAVRRKKYSSETTWSIKLTLCIPCDVDCKDCILVSLDGTKPSCDVVFGVHGLSSDQVVVNRGRWLGKYVAAARELTGVTMRGFLQLCQLRCEQLWSPSGWWGWERCCPMRSILITRRWTT